MSITVRISDGHGNSFTAAVPEAFRIRKNFTLKELANTKAKDSVKFIYNPGVAEFLDELQEFRDWFNKPMTVNSCYRTAAFNASCGGSSNSAHLKGTAMDWGISGHTEKQRQNVINKWKAICAAHKVYGKINLYTNGYHLEAFSDKAYGATEPWRVVDYRGKKGDW